MTDTPTQRTPDLATQPIRVAIDARVPAGQWGGVQQLIQGLASGLSQLVGADEFVFLAYGDAAEWLDPVLGGQCRRLEVAPAHGRTLRRRLYDSLLGRSPRVARAIESILAPLGRWMMPLPVSDGFVESLGVDVLHFATPQAYRTTLPSIYQPLDLLHVHVPESFSALHRRYRDRAYWAFCTWASAVVAMTEWGRTDLVGHFGIPDRKVFVIPLPPVSRPAPTTAPSLMSMRPLPPRYVFYPAQTWSHKNHLAVIEALSILRNKGQRIDLVCTGRKTDEFRIIQRRIEGLGLGTQVQFLGYVSESELGAVYRGATAMIFPSLFEGWGLPVVEAFAWGVPVGCSDIPVLREVAGDAALFFEPGDPAAVAAAISRLWTEEALRASLRKAGEERVAALDWTRTAATYRALYRKVAGVQLSEDDRALLAPQSLVVR